MPLRKELGIYEKITAARNRRELNKREKRNQVYDALGGSKQNMR